MPGRLIIVSNRLPLSARETRHGVEFARSNGGLATALASIFDPATARWVGWPGLRRALKRREVRNSDIPSAYKLIGLDDDTLTGFYDHIANSVWWPMLHGLEPTIIPRKSDWEHAHSAVETFADTIAESIGPDDTVWIHDYQLFWLPRMLRQRGITNKIGFFLHTPFLVNQKTATSYIFRDAIDSLATVDLLGMQTARDIKHWQAIATTLKTRPRAEAFPIGITTADFVRRRFSPRVQTLSARFRQKVGRRTVIVSISRLDYTKGLTVELEAFRTFLRQSKNPQHYLFRLNVAPSRESVAAYTRLKEEVQTLADEINQEFNYLKRPPVWYTYENLDVDHLVAWYRIARVHLNTPVADGMNLIVKEYIAARQLPGVVVMSETAGAADELTSALLVPPNDVAAISDALRRAVSMSSAQTLRRWTRLQRAVFGHQASDWANEFLTALDKLPKRLKK